MSDVRAVVCHHTATLNRTADMPSLDTLINGRPDLSGPLSQFGALPLREGLRHRCRPLQPRRGGAEPVVGQQPLYRHRGGGDRHRRDLAGGTGGRLRPALPRAHRLLRAERFRRARAQGGRRPAGPEDRPQLRHGRVPQPGQCARRHVLPGADSSTDRDPAPHGRRLLAMSSWPSWLPSLPWFESESPNGAGGPPGRAGRVRRARQDVLPVYLSGQALNVRRHLVRAARLPPGRVRLAARAAERGSRAGGECAAGRRSRGPSGALVERLDRASDAAQARPTETRSAWRWS